MNPYDMIKNYDYEDGDWWFWHSIEDEDPREHADQENVEG